MLWDNWLKTMRVYKAKRSNSSVLIHTPYCESLGIITQAPLTHSLKCRDGKLGLKKDDTFTKETIRQRASRHENRLESSGREWLMLKLSLSIHWVL